MGNSKSCRYSRRIALVLEEDFGTSLQGEVYQMNLASKSLFGEGTGDNTHTFENYSKYLSNNGKSLDYVVTQISFNEENDNQSVLFTPTGYINKAQYAVTSEVAKKPEVLKMVVMTPYQADMAGKQAKLEAPAPKAAAPKVESPIEEPTKREKKADPKPTVKKDLDSVVKAWSDEE
jgi:hypothetical protein